MMMGVNVQDKCQRSGAVQSLCFPSVMSSGGPCIHLSRVENGKRKDKLGNWKYGILGYFNFIQVYS